MKWNINTLSLLDAERGLASVVPLCLSAIAFIVTVSVHATKAN